MSKAVILKGPKPESRSFITVLPDSMDALLAKARDLFCVPPNHTPHFTLGDDSSVIVLPDFLPLIREREVLIFRWTPDTPRSSLRRSIGQPIEVHPDAIQMDHRGHQIDESNSTSTDLNKSIRGVRWDDSVISNEEKNKRHAPRSRSQKESRESAASRQRAEYAKQKIQEQEEIRLREEAESSTTKAVAIKSLFGPTTSPPKSDDPFTLSNDATNKSGKSPVSSTTAQLTEQDLLVSGSSPPSYSSPTPKISSHSDEEQQTSSPLASPTRDVRGARKTDHSKAWMMGLGVEKSREQEEERAEEQKEIEEATSDTTKETLNETEINNNVTQADKEQETAHAVIDLTMEDAAEVHIEAIVEPEMEDHMAVVTEEIDIEELEEEQAVEQATSPQRIQDFNVRDIPSYQTMKSVVNQLRSHPSNQAFRQPCSEDFSKFCQEHNRPVVDLFTISNCIVLGKYGVQDPLKQFKLDLDQMWNNIRAFYAPQSQESQCAGLLDTFSGILLEEWNRSNKAAARSTKPRPSIPRTHSTPMSRGEKHHAKPSQDSNSKTQQQAYFASLVAKSGKAPMNISPSDLLSKNLKRSAPMTAQNNQRPVKKQSNPLTPVVSNNGDAKEVSAPEKSLRANARSIATRRSAI